MLAICGTVRKSNLNLALVLQVRPASSSGVCLWKEKSKTPRSMCFLFAKKQLLLPPYPHSFTLWKQKYKKERENGEKSKCTKQWLCRHFPECKAMDFVTTYSHLHYSWILYFPIHLLIKICLTIMLVGSFTDTCKVAKSLSCPTRTFPAEIKEGNTLLSCFSPHTVNKCPCCSLSTMFFTFLCFWLVISLLKMAPELSAKCPFKYKEVMMCVMENMRVR